jgi:anaerobic magnesium-protoporphyrin IX monomethyl ester cyclase
VNVTFIIPPSGFLLDERVFVSLGVLKIAACLEGSHLTRVIDCSGVADYLALVTSQLEGVDVVGITATTPQLPAAVKIASAIREAHPDARIILGGPHVTLVAAACKKERAPGRARAAMATLERSFDILVAGDGELAIHEAIKPGAPKFIDGDDRKGSLFMRPEDYESSPWPARHLIDFESYHYEIEGHKSTSLVAQLGCPFACNFCGGRASNMLRRIRTRSTANVVAEIEHLHRTYGFTGFMFYDDELNVNPKLVELMNAIADLQTRLGVEFRLRGFVKSELFTDAQASAMYRAGFRWILCGFEAADERILENINKKATVEDNSRVVAIAHRNGLKVKALMSIGHAGETEETIRAVHDWLLEVRPDDFDCTVITTYPGCPYYDEAVETSPGVYTFTAKNGDRLHAVNVDYSTTADYYKGNPNGGYHSYVYTDSLSSERIVELRDWVESDVRKHLRAPIQAIGAAAYEHSMGQRHLPMLNRQAAE